MKTQVAAYVCSMLEEALPEGVAHEAIAKLAATRFPLAKPGSRLEARIHLAIMKLVCDPWGSPHPEPDAADKFTAALELGLADWRDLLVSAGLEHEDWPQVLIEAGYQGPTKS